MMRTTESSVPLATSGSHTGLHPGRHFVTPCPHRHSRLHNPRPCLWQTTSQQDRLQPAHGSWLRAMCRIPHEYLKGTKQFLGSALPDSPLLVFINSRSGGRAGARLTEVLCHAIGHSQVQAAAPRFALGCVPCFGVMLYPMTRHPGQEA